MNKDVIFFKEKVEQETDSLLKAKAYNELANSLCNNGEYEESRKNANLALNIAKSYNDSNIIFRSNQLIGVSYAVQGLQQDALTFFNLCLEISEVNSNHKQRVTSNMNIGNVNYNLGYYERALSFYHEAMKDSLDNNYSDLIPKLYNNIGTVLMEICNYKEALIYYKKSLKEKIKQDDKAGIANCLSNLGTTYSRMEDYPLALGYYKRALKIFRELNLAHYIAISCFNIGSCYNSSASYLKALEYMLETINISKDYNLLGTKQQAYVVVANIYENLGKLDMAEDYYHTYIGEIDNIFDGKNKLFLYSKYADFCKKTGKLDIAIQYFEKYIDLNKTMFNEDLAKGIASMKSKLDYEQKKYEAEIYRLKNVELLKNQNEIELQKEELIHLNKSKDTILNIVSHDLKNSIGSIQTALELINRDGENLKISRYLDIINDQSTKALNLVRDILDANRIEMDSYQLDLYSMDINLILKTYEKSLNDLASVKSIKIEFNYQQKELNCLINIEKFWQIIYNLCSNAIKFSHQNTTIKVIADLEIVRNMAYARIDIIDQGIGIDNMHKGYIFEKFSKASKKGTMGEDSTGLGLSIVKRLVTLHNGFIEFKSRINRGSSFSIYIPIEKEES